MRHKKRYPRLQLVSRLNALIVPPGRDAKKLGVCRIAPLKPGKTPDRADDPIGSGKVRARTSGYPERRNAEPPQGRSRRENGDSGTFPAIELNNRLLIDPALGLAMPDDSGDYIELAHHVVRQTVRFMCASCGSIGIAFDDGQRLFRYGEKVAGDDGIVYIMWEEELFCSQICRTDYSR